MNPVRIAHVIAALPALILMANAVVAADVPEPAANTGDAHHQVAAEGLKPELMAATQRYIAAVKTNTRSALEKALYWMPADQEGTARRDAFMDSMLLQRQIWSVCQKAFGNADSLHPGRSDATMKWVLQQIQTGQLQLGIDPARVAILTTQKPPVPPLVWFRKVEGAWKIDIAASMGISSWRPKPTINRLLAENQAIRDALAGVQSGALKSLPEVQAFLDAQNEAEAQLREKWPKSLPQCKTAADQKITAEAAIKAKLLAAAQRYIAAVKAEDKPQLAAALFTPPASLDEKPAEHAFYQGLVLQRTLQTTCARAFGDTRGLRSGMSDHSLAQLLNQIRAGVIDDSTGPETAVVILDVKPPLTSRIIFRRTAPGWKLDLLGSLGITRWSQLELTRRTVDNQAMQDAISGVRKGTLPSIKEVNQLLRDRDWQETQRVEAERRGEWQDSLQRSPTSQAASTQKAQQ